jgi:hypothetical protein
MAIGDLDLPQISFTGLPQTTEGNGYVTFTIELSEPVSAPVTLFYRTIPGTADDRSVDFDSTLDDIRFEANTTVATFSVYVRSDAVGERDESYFVELFNPVGASFGGRNHSLRATGWILDEDAGGGRAPSRSRRRSSSKALARPGSSSAYPKRRPPTPA